MKNPLKFWLGTLTVFLLALTPSVVPVGPFVDEAQATPNVGVGTVCEQTVGDNTGVVVSKAAISSVDYCFVTFTSAATTTWTVPPDISAVSFLAVGGGGAGGSGAWGGGGGAGEVVTYSNLAATPGGNFTVSIGSGGESGSSNHLTTQGGNDLSTPGDPSTVSNGSVTVTAAGGGRGASYSYSGSTTVYSWAEGGDGGSGGGASEASTNSGAQGGASTASSTGSRVGYGHNGGSSWLGGSRAGGGGGGSGSAGVDVSQNVDVAGGAGGEGTTAVASWLSSISSVMPAGWVTATTDGSDRRIAGGGGGGAQYTAGAGGAGGGGVGGTNDNNVTRNGTAGVTNTGSGGGGASFNGSGGLGGAGGSGIVILRYALEPPDEVTGFQLSAERYVDAGTDTDSVTLQWNAAAAQTPSVTGYEIKYSTNADMANPSTVPVSGASTTSQEITGLTDGATYYFEIYAKNANDQLSTTSPKIVSRALSAEDHALSLNGALSGSSIMRASGSSIIPSSGGFTAEAWINPDSDPSDYQAILFQGTSTSDRFAFYYTSDSHIHIGRDSNTVNVEVGDITGRWSHIAVSVDQSTSTNNVKVYLNGALLGTNSLAGGDGAGDPFYLGVDGRTGLAHPFGGEIDQVKVWEGVLSQTQIEDSMHSWDDTGVTSSPTLISHYDFNDNTQGTVLRDMHTSNDLTISNAATTDFEPLVERDTASRSGYAVYEFTRSYLTADGGWTVPSGVTSVDYLVVGGGGGGGSGNASEHGGGGGGAGGFRGGTVSLSGEVEVTVGAGGAGGVSRSAGHTGQDSVLSTVVSDGGGGGGSYGYPATTGGSGGGAGAGLNRAVAAGSSGQGSSGGTVGLNGTAGRHGAGGGGAGGAGGNTTNNGSITMSAGQGGVGLVSSITGSSTYYAAGGGGGGSTKDGGSGGASGGNGGGGTGSTWTGSSTTQATVGSANTGGGGGGGSGTGGATESFGAAGGSGVVVVAFRLSYTLTLDNEGATSTQTVAFGANPSDPGLSRSGFTLSGWSDADDSVAEYATDLSDYTMGAGDDTLFAVWVGDALAPTFGSPTSTSDGFTVSITNYDAAFTWNPTVSSGSVSAGTASGATQLLTVTGLSPGQSATVTVSTSRSSYTSGSATVSGSASTGAALTPVFGTPTPTADGFTVSITNYDASYTWGTPTVSAGSVGAGTPSGSTLLLTVTGLTPEQSATITQTTSRSGYTSGSATVSGTASTGAALTPTFGTFTPTPDGFTVQISNYDSDYTWAGSATASGSVSISGTGLVTVSGVAAGVTSALAITTTRSGYSTGSGNISGIAALVVDLDAGNSSSYPGSGSTWTNLVDETDYTIANGTFSSNNGGAIVFNGSSTRVPLGQPLANGTNYTKEAWVLDQGTSGPRNIVSSYGHPFYISGTALRSGLSGSFSLVNSANFPNNVWRHVVVTFNDSTNTMSLYIDGVRVNQNTAVNSSYTPQDMFIGSHSDINGNVFSFWNGSIAKVRVYNTALTGSQVTARFDATKSAYALNSALTPTFGTPTATSDGFTVQISNYDSDYTWAGSATASGSVSISGTGLVTVTGVAASTSSTATITASRTGYENGSATVSATSLATYTVTFDSNYSGGASDTTQSIVGSQATALTANPFNRTGYTFVEWTTAANGSGTAYANQESVTLSVDVTLYAQWTNMTTSNLIVNLDASNLQSLSDSSTTWRSVRPGSSTSSQTGQGNVAYSNAGGVRALTFDGEQDYFEYTDVSDTNISGAMTLEMWVKPADLRSGWNILATRWFSNTAGAGANDWHFALRQEAGSTMRLNLFTTSTSNIYGSTVFSSNSDWVLVGFTIDASGNQKFFVNGVQDGTTRTGVTHTANSNAKFFIGDPRVGTGFAGSISSVRLYDTALSSSQMLANFEADYESQGFRQITFDENVGAGSDTTKQYVVNNRATNLTANPFTRDGYRFTGWDTAANGSGTGFSNSQSVTRTADLTLYAQWEVDTYTITLEKGSVSGAAGSNQTLTKTHGVALVLPNSATANDDFTKTGYTVTGWSINADGSTTDYALGANYTTDAADTLYPVWTANTYTVTYDYNGATGGNSVSSVSYTVDGIRVGLPSPTKTGYTFGGWYSDDNTFNNLVGAAGGSYSPTADITIYAEWNAATFTVIFQYNGATSGNADDDDSYTTGGTAITLPTPVRTGYTFGGWYSNAGLTTSVGAAGASYSPTSNLTIYAKWTAVSRSVTYNSTNSTSGTVPTDGLSYIIGDTVVVKANSGSLERTGYTFAGWVTNSDGSGTALNAGETITVANADIDLYPQWAEGTYTITYHRNGASGAPARSTDSYTTGDSNVTLSGVGTLTKTGYTFGGWATTPGGADVGTTYSTTEDVTLYAVWTIKSITYTYVKGDDSDDDPITVAFNAFPTGASQNYGTSITLSTGVDAEIDTDSNGEVDHKFFGWSDGTTVYDAGDTYILGDTNPTFTAQWVKVYSVRYSLAGGSLSGSDLVTDAQCLGTNETCTDGQSITLNSAPTRSGYTFLGWEDQSGTLHDAGDTISVSSTRYLFYAQWQAVSYNMNFNSLGGSNAISNQTKTIGQLLTMPNPGTKTGYTFGGWSDGTLLLGVGSTFTVGASSKSFSAQWIADVYAVTYDWQGGTSSTPKVSDSYTVGNGDMSLPTAAAHGYTRDGYTFSGWSESPGGSLVSGYRPSAPDTLYAVWADGTFTLTYDAQGGTIIATTASIARTTSTILATPTRANFTHIGWFTAASGGTKVGDAGDSFTPSASTTVYSRWVQDSLYGVDEATLETATTTITADGTVGNDQSASATSGSSRADVVVPGGALPDGTIVKIRYFRDTDRQSSLISGDNTYFFSVLVSWLYGTGTSATVPDTHPNRPVEVTLTNSAIKAGARVYQVIGTQVTDLGVATSDGTVTVELFTDPQLVVAATAPSAPISVSGTSGDTRATVSWTAGSSGGSSITGYTVTASPGGATCSTASTSCTISSLTNNTPYTFTVRATNALGTSSASSASSPVTPVGANYTVTFDSNGGSAVSDGTFFSGSTVSAPSSPSRSGFTFRGWSTVQDDDTTAVTFPYAPGVTSAITLFALWEVAPAAPTSGGSSGGPVTMPVPATTRPPVVVPPRVLGPTQPVVPPRPFMAPVVIVPERGFDPDAGSQARVGGLPATVTKTTPSQGGVSVGVGRVTVGITPTTPQPSGAAPAPGRPSDVSVSTGQSATVSGGGLLPGSQLQVWLPGLSGDAAKELARIPVKTDGTFESELTFSAGQSDTPVPIGRQVIQVTGFDELGNQTIVDMTITIGQGEPSPEPNRSVNALPDLAPGQSLATSAGVPETVAIEARPDTREVAVVSGEWNFNVSLPDDAGEVEQVDAGATITLVQAKTASVSGEGFQPDTRVDIWLFSDPTLLGSVTVSADGAFTGEVFLDARYAVVGEHTLQLQGVGVDGFIKAANLGVVVEEPALASPVIDSSMMLWVVMLALLVALVIAVLLIARRRQLRS